MTVLFEVIAICLLIGYIVRQIRYYKQEKPEYECNHDWELVGKTENLEDWYYSYLHKCNNCGKFHNSEV